MEFKPESRENSKEQEAHKKISEIRRMLSKVPNAHMEIIEKVMDEISTYASYLQKKYPNARKHALFHALISSTPAPGQELIYEDLPGEDSILAFVAKMEAKYLK